MKDRAPKDEIEITPEMIEAEIILAEIGGADYEESAVLRDALSRGIGWTETRLEDGELKIERVDPLEVYSNTDE